MLLLMNCTFLIVLPDLNVLLQIDAQHIFIFGIKMAVF